MTNLFLTAFVLSLLAMGLRKPFAWVLAYVYVDIVAPQKVSWGFLSQVPVSLILVVFALAAYFYADDKRDSRFTLRQALMVLLLGYAGYTTVMADFPEEAMAKWDWVWKALVFAVFLPLTLRTRLRFEAVALTIVLALAAIVISGGMKTAFGGGGYGHLRLLVDNNSGIYESSIISCAAIAALPLIVWLAKYGTVFPPDWRVRLFALALGFACLLIPVGTEARTGLLCLGVLIALVLRTMKRRVLYGALMAVAGLMAIPFLPASFTERMDTIGNHQADQSASTRIAVWKWTLDYVETKPFGGGFDAYRGNSIRYETKDATKSGSTVSVDTAFVEDAARAYHSSYFEMLGEQGWPGLVLWLWLMVSGVWQMERLHRRWKHRQAEHERWAAPLALALQQAQVVFLVGSVFVGIAYQPFFLMLVALQCGLWSYLWRIEREEAHAARIANRRAGLVVPAAA